MEKMNNAILATKELIKLNEEKTLLLEKMLID